MMQYKKREAERCDVHLQGGSALKPCPFCGEIPYIEKKPLWRTHGDGTTRGYYGSFEYDIRCHKCGCNIPLPRNDTIYNNDAEAKQNAINAWNTRWEGGQQDG